MKRTNLVEFADLIRHGTTIGYKWNDGCHILDDIYEMISNECSTVEIEYEDYEEGDGKKVYMCEDLLRNKDAEKIVESFMIKNKISEMTVTRG